MLAHIHTTLFNHLDVYSTQCIGKSMPSTNGYSLVMTRSSEIGELPYFEQRFQRTGETPSFFPPTDTIYPPCTMMPLRRSQTWHAKYGLSRSTVHQHKRNTQSIISGLRYVSVIHMPGHQGRYQIFGQFFC